jgi:hypothetical protein
MLCRRADSVVAAAHRGKAIVFREYLTDSKKAHEALDNGKAKLGHEHLLLQDYRAKLFSLDKDFEKAISIWNSIESELERTENPSRVFTYRDAEFAAAGLNDWNSVADLALKAEKAARSSSYKGALAVGFHADYAFALWMGGERKVSISAFVEVVGMLGRLGSVEEDLTAYTLQRKVSHVIAWLKQEIQGGDKVPKPPPGWFSDQGSPVEKTEPVDPELNLWYNLAEIEYSCRAGDVAFKLFEQIAETDKPLVQAAVAKLRLGHALRKQPPSANLITELGDFYTKLNACGETFGRTPPDLNSHAQMVGPFLFASLVVACSSHNYPSAPVLEEWRESAERLQLGSASLTRWLDTVGLWSKPEDSELVAVMKDSNAKTEIRVLASLLLTARDDTDPGDLFYANVGLITAPNIFGLWAEDVETYVAEIICESWLRAVKHQRFALLSPNLTVPAITNACESDSNGFQKAARVVVAARNAVQSRLDDSLLQRLKEISADSEYPTSIATTP